MDDMDSPVYKADLHVNTYPVTTGPHAPDADLDTAPPPIRINKAPIRNTNTSPYPPEDRRRSLPSPIRTNDTDMPRGEDIPESRPVKPKKSSPESLLAESFPKYASPLVALPKVEWGLITSGRPYRAF